jgi:hypothetical protein
MLEARLEEAKIGRSSGQIFDDNGSLHFVEYTVQDRERQTAYFQGMVDAVRQYCHVLPAYGSEAMPEGFERAHEVLEDEEYAALLLTAEKNAILFTVDGRLAQFGLVTSELKSVWPQEVLRYAGESGKLSFQQYTFAVIRMFLRNRSFVSLGAYDLVFMCQQGGYALTEGLLRFKDYLASASTDLGSAMSVAFEFLELQARHPTQFKAFAELVGHVVEAGLRHPECDHEQFLRLAFSFVNEMARNSNGPFVPYTHVEDFRRAHSRIYTKVLWESIESAANLATKPPCRRAIKLRVLKCMQPPYLTFDSDVKEPEDASVSRLGLAEAEDLQARDVKIPEERSQAYLVLRHTSIDG